MSLVEGFINTSGTKQGTKDTLDHGLLNSGLNIQLAHPVPSVTSVSPGPWRGWPCGGAPTKLAVGTGNSHANNAPISHTLAVPDERIFTDVLSNSDPRTRRM